MPTHIIIFKFYINDFSCSKEAVKGKKKNQKLKIVH